MSSPLQSFVVDLEYRSGIKKNSSQLVPVRGFGSVIGLWKSERRSYGRFRVRVLILLVASAMCWSKMKVISSAGGI